MLADAPEEQRRAMMKSRLEMVAAMPDDQRLNAMSEMVSAIARFPEDKRRRMVSTRNRIIAEFPPSIRESIMQTRIKLVTTLPKEVNEKDIKTMIQMLPELPDDLRVTFVNSLKSSFEAADMPLPPIPGIAMPTPQPTKEVAPVAAPTAAGPADMVKAQESMMRQLATAPEDMRKSGLTARWNEILAGSDQTVVDSIKVMMQAVARLPDEQRRTLIRTRTEVVGSLSEDQIKRILSARVEAMKGLDRLDKEDQTISIEEMPWVPEGPRMHFANAMTSFMKSMGMSSPPMASTPVHHGRPMEKKGLFSKSWKCAVCDRGFPAT